VKNNAPLPDAQGFAGASNVTVRDLLPLELRCATVSAISNGGTCTDPVPDVAGARSQINWTVPGPILPQGTQTLTYTVTLPTDLAPSEDLTNDAGVRTYTGPVNTGLTPTTYIPASNIDPTLTSNIPDVARDSETVTLSPVAVVKQQQSELSESGNSRNASLATSADRRRSASTWTTSCRRPSRHPRPCTGDVHRSSAQRSDTAHDRSHGVTPTAFLNGGALPVNWSFNAGTLTVTLADPYLVDNTADVIEMHFRAIVDRHRQRGGPEQGQHGQLRVQDEGSRDRRSAGPDRHGHRQHVARDRRAEPRYVEERPTLPARSPTGPGHHLLAHVDELGAPRRMTSSSPTVSRCTSP